MPASVRSARRFATLALGLATFVALMLQFSGGLRADDAPGKFELRPGDRICIIGNTLAERMQHDGWLETVLQSRFPKHELVLRNLGFSGDEIVTRLRSQDFGTPDQHLAKHKADVIFAFFGFNESFGGEAGLDKFTKELDAFVKHTLGEKYNGQSAPRLVLFSPIANEDLHNRNLPDGSENNRRIELYTRAMAEVAKANRVAFVDLYKPTLELYRTVPYSLDPQRRQSLTINGIHLTENGNRHLAQVIDKALFPNQPEVKRDPQAVEKLRQAIIDKDFYWFERYRTVDGYSIFGGRADLAFVGGQTNRVVAQREMEVLDIMTANRDKRIWAVAQGGDLAVDDSNTPPFIPVETNKPGPPPTFQHVFADPEAAINDMQVAKGMKINLFASEKEFPELAKPVQMAFDAKGRLWVAAWPTYPHWKPKEEMNDKLLIFEDTDGDGRADKMTVFADHLHCPTGFEFYNGGVLIAQAPDLMFLKDTDGDDKADVRVRVLHGLDSADTHHTSNSFVLDPGGALYFQEGTFHHTQVETLAGPQRCANAGVFRYEPRSQKFDVYVSYGFANPHGHVFDHWGQDFVTDGTGAVNYFAAAFSGHVDFPNKHGGLKPFFDQRTRPCPATEILSSRHFPDELQGNYLIANVIGVQGILQYKMRDDGSGFAADEVEPIVLSPDEKFRPTDLKIGPDGAIYFIDWQNPIIGHMQHNLRDPSRDRTHGRVYRVTYPSRPLLKAPKIAAEPIEKLLDLLKEPEDNVRSHVKIELGARNSDQVIAAVDKWAANLDKKDPEYEHYMLEALWVHQYHNVVDVNLLSRLLKSPDYRARAAATRVLCYWRDRVSDSLELLKKMAADEHPRVRLEAVRAASFYAVPDAIEVPLVSAEFPTDYYLDYTRGETMKTLEPYWKRALAEGRHIPITSPAGAKFIFHNLTTDELLKLERSRGVYLEMLFRKGLKDDYRREAVGGLAKLDGKSDLAVLLDAIRSQDGQQADSDESVTFDLVRLLTGRNAKELAGVRGELEKLATGSKLPVNRQIGYVALIAADGGVEKVWQLATRSTRSLADLLGAMPLVPDPSLRAELYPKVQPLLQGLPPQLIPADKTAKGTYGRFVRVEIPGMHTLTLAEVEVSSDGRNVARQGKATQTNTVNGGEASRAIDGNKSSNWGDGGQTHTAEGTDNPWWEVDLGEEVPIDSIAIYNRTDGELFRRLEGFTLKVLDAQRNEVFAKEKIAAPRPSVSFDLEGGGPESAIRRAAMLALTSVRGQEVPTFQALAKFTAGDRDRHAAVQALARIPASYWQADDARGVLDNIVAYLRKVPVNERTSPAALDSIQLGYSLAAVLPLDQARAVRKELGELGVMVVRINTVPDQMIYDKERFVVQAGKPVEIVFENVDIMPHNFVITQPGALEEIGQLAEAQATQPGALERNYVPQSDKILLKSQLLTPRQSQKLSYVVPAAPGVYPYVCTYPGHYRRMYGAMYVVADLEQYLAGPEDYLAAHPLPIADELLKFNRPRTEWKFDDLAKSVEELEHGRSFGNGKQMFQVANCVACHKLNGVGAETGPDLAKLDAKLTAVDILRDIVEPSFRINEKFQTYIIETDSGKLITGLIVEDTPQVVKVLDNPLAKAPPVELKPSEIVERKKSATSIMPKGLLDKMTREEILDLVAYIAARGDEGHPLYHGAGHNHAGH